MLPAVFVSYSHKDADFARQLVADITPRIRSVWFDEVSIRPGRYWDDEIERGIQSSDVLLSLLSPNLLESKICKDEFDNADRLGKPVIPILVTQCENEKMWMRMARRQWVDFRSDYGLGLTKLLNGLAHLGEYAVPLMQKCLVCELESSSNEPLCPNCNSPYSPNRLGQIYTFSPQYLQKYLSFFSPRTTIANAGVNDILVVALVHLVMRSYDVASTCLERVLAHKPDSAYAWYMLAMAKLRGRRPRLLTRSDALDIQACLIKSIAFDMMLAQSYLYLALLKTDYFESKGFKVESPTIIECLERANRGILDKAELRAMLEFVPVADGKLIQTLHYFAQ